MSAVLDALLAKDPETRDVEFCADRAVREALGAVQSELAEARGQLARAGSAGQDRVDQLRGRVAELEASEAALVDDAQAQVIRFTFAALDPADFDRLKDEHPPTPEQKAKARRDDVAAPDWNEDTFSPALVAASCVRVESPAGATDGLSLEDAQVLWKSRAYNGTERALLFYAALGASTSAVRVDLSKRS